MDSVRQNAQTSFLILWCAISVLMLGCPKPDESEPVEVPKPKIYLDGNELQAGTPSAIESGGNHTVKVTFTRTNPSEHNYILLLISKLVGSSSFVDDKPYQSITQHSVGTPSTVTFSPISFQAGYSYSIEAWMGNCTDWQGCTQAYEGSDRYTVEVRQTPGGTQEPFYVLLGASINLQARKVGTSPNQTLRIEQYTGDNNAGAEINVVWSLGANPTVYSEPLAGKPGVQRFVGRFYDDELSGQIPNSLLALASGLNISTTITVSRPTRLGTTDGTITYNGQNTDLDALIIKYAGKYGVPPHYLKAQISREAKRTNGRFDPSSYRYEPVTLDYKRVSVNEVGSSPDVANYILETSPYSLFRLATPAERGHVALSQGTSLTSQDIDVRNIYNRSDLNLDGYLSAQEYVTNNPSQNWNNTQSYNLQFTAQTSIAASYGLLQVLYTTAIAPIGWNDQQGRHPSALLVPETIVELAAKYLSAQYTQRTGEFGHVPNWSNDVPNWNDANQNSIPDDGEVSASIESDWFVAMGAYNAGSIPTRNKAYAFRVLIWQGKPLLYSPQ